jgi:hypothetical protein
LGSYFRIGKCFSLAFNVLSIKKQQQKNNNNKKPQHFFAMQRAKEPRNSTQQ